VGAIIPHHYIRTFRALHGVSVIRTADLSPKFMTSSVRAYLGASREGLARYHFPRIGLIAERWVFEE